MTACIELVRETLTAFIDGDVDAALEAASPNIVCVRTPPLPDPQTHHGHAGVLEMWNDWTREFDRFEMAVGELAEVRGRVIGEIIQRATGRASGVEVEGRFWFVYTLAGWQITRLDAFATEEQALAAIPG